MTQVIVLGSTSKNDLGVAIDATIKAMIADGSRTFLAGSIAKEIRKTGMYVYGPDVGKYLSRHPAFCPVCTHRKHIRWQLVGEL